MSASVDPYHLARFTDAQSGVFERALSELEAGRKASHWMWFVFPQLAGLGLSAMARRYAIASLDEARAYLAHPVLGKRLRRAAEALLAHEALSARDVLGALDSMKLRSCLTLFVRAGGGAPFDRALARFFDSQADPATVALLSAAPPPSGGAPAKPAGGSKAASASDVQAPLPGAGG